METKLTEHQKEFLSTLVDCGVSMNALIAVGVVINTDDKIHEMSSRLLSAADSGKEITDGLLGQILTDMMTEGLA